IDDSFNYMDDGELRNIQVLEDDRIALGGDFSAIASKAWPGCDRVEGLERARLEGAKSSPPLGRQK
ncbi:MAG: hypothetical protein AAGE52_42465, partial [Myxococcota bacterium]